MAGGIGGQGGSSLAGADGVTGPGTPGYDGATGVDYGSSGGGGGGSGLIGAEGGVGGGAADGRGLGGQGGATPGAAGFAGEGGAFGAVGGGGGGGGGGAHGYVGVTLPTSIVAGGSGGQGGDGSLNQAGFNFTYDGSGGGGGDGGYGAVITGKGALGTLLTSITGASGGAGGSGLHAGQGGDGGIGLDLIAANSSLTIDAAVTGGAAGQIGLSTDPIPSYSQIESAGGVGLVGSGVDLTIGSSGVISGGIYGNGLISRADAIDFIGGANILRLDAGVNASAITGTVGVGGSLTFDVAAGASATFAAPLQSYEGESFTLAKTGAGTLVLSNESLGSSIDLFAGTLELSGSYLSNVSFKDGAQTLVVDHAVGGGLNVSNFAADGDKIDLTDFTVSSHAVDSAEPYGSNLVLYGPSGIFVIEFANQDYTHAPFSITSDGASGTEITLIPDAPLSFVGTGGADLETSGSGADTLSGNGGSDTLVGGGGADLIRAGAENGSPAGSSSDVTLLEGDGGADTIVGGVGHDQIFGNMGDDDLVLVAGSQGALVYGGQGNDFIDATASGALHFLSGDIGNDTILCGAGSETVLGGQGDDSIVGGDTADAHSLQLLFGNQGNDVISYAGHGSVEIFGGEDNDRLSVTASGEGQARYLFGNLGDDTLTATGGYDSLYGGQGSDLISAANDSGGHNYLSGDIGNDTVTASAAGSDTVRGGRGADAIVLGAHTAPDTVLVGAGESSAQPGAGEVNLDHVSNFDFARDQIVLIGAPAGSAANTTTYTDPANNSTEAQAFSAAYTYAYGDGTSAHTAHVGATEYLAVSESYGGNNAIYVFTADHTAVAFTGVTASSFQPGAIIDG